MFTRRVVSRGGTRPGIIASLLLFLSAAACGGEAPPDAPVVTAPVVLTDEEALAMPIAELTAEAERWAAAARAAEASADGVAAGREAARLYRLAAFREPVGTALDTAQALLEEASRRRNVEGACAASLDLARLLARDRGDGSAAFLVAYRSARRFATEPDAECAAEARRMTVALEPFRPDAARLGAIDADPDRGDPSVGLGEGEGDTDDGADPLERWTLERRTEGGHVTVSSISTFGEAGADSARVVVALDGVAHFSHEELPAEGDVPRRLVLSLEGASLGTSVEATVASGAGGLVRVRSAGDDEGVRVVLDLEPRAEARLYALPEPFRVVVDLSRPPEADHEHEVDLIVLDPGHGGDDYGARAFGLHEADLALDLALRVRDILARRAPGVRVVLTRENDTFVSLEQRAAMANAIDADAFVSIHLNAADEDVDHGGITTFVLDTTDDRAALRLAARENGTGTAAVTELQRILAGLHREDQVAGSRALAERVHRSLLTSGRTILPRLYDRHVRSAMFYVLVGAVMPAILVEASFMTREDEARALRTEAYRDALARGIADGIVRYAE